MCSKHLFAPPTHNIINNIMNQTIVQFYPDATKSLIALTNALLISAAARTKKPFYLALSGGETARSLFEIWKNQYNDPKRWKNVHFFWVDERCVSSENEESNYHWAEKLFFKPVWFVVLFLRHGCCKKATVSPAIRYFIGTASACILAHRSPVLVFCCEIP